MDQCCGETPYGSGQCGVLCCNNTLYEDRVDGQECSEMGIPYNPAKGTICCSQFHGSPGQHCCGTEIYRPDVEICCNGHRHPKSENIHCCGVKAYNIKDPQMKCCAGTLYTLTSLHKHGGDLQCCGSTLQEPQDICCSSEEEEVIYSAKTGFRCCGHLYYNTTLWSCCAGRLRSIHEPGQGQRKMINESRVLSVNNLNKTDLCQKMHIGTVESVSQQSVVFGNVLTVHGMEAEALPFPYVLETDDRCSFPKLVLGKTYFFNKVNVFTDFNHDSVLQSLHFIISKCSP
ncbi:usherin-like [Maylandia zebra]|uniref:usherin-like n=1 Tax=Maylandia zebra TaxID=106582 RepID=UPI000329C6F9|nr:galaxin-like [Maylandia zebra]